MSDLLRLLNQIPQAERGSDTGRALARLIASQAAAKFQRSHEAQEMTAQYNREAFTALPGDQPRGPFQEPNVAQMMQQPHDETPTDEEMEESKNSNREDLDGMNSHLEAIQRMRSGGTNE